MELVPESIQFALLQFVEQQSRERRIVAEVTGHQMEPRAQQPSFALLVFLQKDEAALRNVKGIGKNRAKASKSCLVAGAPDFIARHNNGALHGGVQRRLAFSLRKTLQRR